MSSSRLRKRTCIQHPCRYSHAFVYQYSHALQGKRQIPRMVPHQTRQTKNTEEQAKKIKFKGTRQQPTRTQTQKDQTDRRRNTLHQTAASPHHTKKPIGNTSPPTTQGSTRRKATQKPIRPKHQSSKKDDSAALQERCACAHVHTATKPLLALVVSEIQRHTPIPMHCV